MKISRCRRNLGTSKLEKCLFTQYYVVVMMTMKKQILFTRPLRHTYHIQKGYVKIEKFSSFFLRHRNYGSLMRKTKNT